MADDERSNGIIRSTASSIANYVCITAYYGTDATCTGLTVQRRTKRHIPLRQTGKLGRVQSSIHAYHKRRPAGRGKCKLSFLAKSGSIFVVSLQNMVIVGEIAPTTEVRLRFNIVELLREHSQPS
jgi:hypothetical protein